MNTPPNRKPHDEFFKTTFSNQRVAEAYIRRFLPSPLVKNLQLEKLELAKASYISKQLKPYFSDIVYTCPYHDDTINLSFLYEHKSYPVAYPHIQILRYILEVWERNIFIFLEEHMDKPEGENFVERIFVYLIRSSVFENVKLKDMVDNIKDSFRKPAKSAYDRLIGEGDIPLPQN